MTSTSLCFVSIPLASVNRTRNSAESTWRRSMVRVDRCASCGAVTKLGLQETVLREGSFHRGRAALTHFIARKAGVNPAAAAVTTPEARLAEIDQDAETTQRAIVALRARLNRIHQRTGELTAKVNRAPERSDLPYRPLAAQAYRDSIDVVFDECEPANGGACGGTGGVDEAPRRADVGEDQLLLSAGTSVRDSCLEATRSGWCRYCWVPGPRCICTDVGHRIDAAAAASEGSIRDLGFRRLPLPSRQATPLPSLGSALGSDPSVTPTILRTVNPTVSPARNPDVSPAISPDVSIHWVILSHPSEFLRSTSSAKIAVQVLAALPGSSSELLVYGCPQHNRRLDEILSDDAGVATSTLLLPYCFNGVTALAQQDHNARRALHPTWRLCALDADWCLQSCDMTNAGLQASPGSSSRHRPSPTPKRLPQHPKAARCPPMRLSAEVASCRLLLRTHPPPWRPWHPSTSTKALVRRPFRWPAGPCSRANGGHWWSRTGPGSVLARLCASCGPGSRGSASPPPRCHSCRSTTARSNCTTRR